MKISEESREFLENVRGESELQIVRPVVISTSRVSPGDVLMFRYYNGVGPGSRGQKIVLVVKTRRGQGFFPGKEGILMSCFRLTTKSEETIAAIIDSLYKKRRVSSYYGKIKESLEKLLGKGSFRTYKLSKIKESYTIEII